MPPETLDMIEKCASAGMPIEATCAICEITEADYMASDDAQKRYEIGRLKTEFAVRQSVVALAQKGDARMVKLYFDLTRPNNDLSPEDLKEIEKLVAEE